MFGLGEELLQFLVAVWKPVQQFLTYSSVLGQVLVYLILTAVDLVRSLHEVCSVLWTDYLFFIHDFFEKILGLKLWLAKGGWSAYQFAVDTVVLITGAASMLAEHIGYTFQACFLIITTGLCGVWNMVLLLLAAVSFIGNTALMAIAFLPNTIAAIVAAVPSGCAKALRCLQESLFKLDHAVNIFFTSIPLNMYVASIFGTFICCFIIINFNAIVMFGFITTKRSFLALCRIVDQCWTGEFFENHRQRASSPTPSVMSVSTGSVAPGESQDQTLCIVCLTAPKNVLNLPCRHVCACLSCTAQLGPACPLCRKKVRRTMQIYV